MEFNLYTQLSEKNAVFKVLQNGQTFQGNILEETSIINPVFLVAGQSIYQFNYMYVESFHRYYFIDNITSVRNGLWRVECSVDVLMSFRSQISDLSCIVDKQESQFYSNEFLNDGSFICDSRVSIEAV